MRATSQSRLIVRLSGAARLLGAVLAVVVLSGVARAGDGDKACLDCHADQRLSVQRHGTRVSLHIDAAEAARSVHADLACTDCHEGVDAAARPHHGSAPPVDCRGCHANVAHLHPFHPDFAKTPFVVTAETDCSGCHGTHGTPPASGPKSAFAGAKATAACGDCHEEAAGHFANSAHGAALAAGRPEAPDCLSCHRKPVASGPDLLKLKQEQSRLCLGCHRDDKRVLKDSAVSRGFIVSYSSSVHGMSLAQGKAKAANCVDCHGSHETAGALSAGSRVSLQNIQATLAARWAV